VPEIILDPELPIIDPHHHLWDRRTEITKELPPSGDGFVDLVRAVPRYLFDELMADLKSGHNVRSTVFVESGAMYRADGPEAFRCVGETEFVGGMAAMSASGQYGDVRACAGIVGHADLCFGDPVADVLLSHVAAGHGRFRGIRQHAPYDDDPEVLGPAIAGRVPAGLYLDAKFRQGFRHLRELGLSFDAWVLEPQLPDVIDLARTFPDTSIVLDHAGTPLGLGRYAGTREGRFGIWETNIETLAACANVSIKIGGFGMPLCGWRAHMAGPDETSDVLAAQWKPYVESCIEAFGPDRCMFESNFPVDRFSATYIALWNAFKLLTTGCSADERRSLFSGTASRVYRLEIT